MMRRMARGMTIVLVLTAATIMATAAPALLEVKSTLAGVVLGDDLAVEGTRVDDGQPLVYVRTTLTGTKAVAARAPRDGIVRAVLVQAGQRVDQGDVVVRLEPR